jgi:hypothetical protein
MPTHNVPVTLLAGAIISGLVACGTDTPTDAAVARMAPLSVGASDDRPLSGSCETSFAPPTLPPPPIIRQVDRGTCTLSHLGRTSFYAVQDIDPVAGTQQSVEITFTAANGDILRAASVGTNAPSGPGVTFSATMTFTGGTGRFVNATGEAQIDGSASFITNSASFRLNGGITYDGSKSKK